MSGVSRPANCSSWHCGKSFRATFLDRLGRVRSHPANKWYARCGPNRDTTGSAQNSLRKDNGLPIAIQSRQGRKLIAGDDSHRLRFPYRFQSPGGTTASSRPFPRKTTPRLYSQIVFGSGTNLLRRDSLGESQYLSPTTPTVKVTSRPPSALAKSKTYSFFAIFFVE